MVLDCEEAIDGCSHRDEALRVAFDSLGQAGKDVFLHGMARGQRLRCMYGRDGVVVEREDRQGSRVAWKPLFGFRCYVRDVSITEGCANQKFRREVFHDAEVEGYEEVIQTEVQTELTQRFDCEQRRRECVPVVIAVVSSASAVAFLPRISTVVGHIETAVGLEVDLIYVACELIEGAGWVFGMIMLGVVLDRWVQSL